MNEQTYREVSLTNITPCPKNPRKTFAGTEFDDLVASVTEKGVLQPILIRPVDGLETDYELVAGERRYRASCYVAEFKLGSLEDATIPAMIRELTDEEAFDLMMLENLHRADLNEREEAEGFKAYLDERGETALPDLAGRTGINARYIRRRIAVLKLPEVVLEAWENGTLKYGHLEQLIRMENEDDILEIMNSMKNAWQPVTISDLKNKIDSNSIDLEKALFSRSDCKRCDSNTEVQLQLFDLGTRDTQCLRPGCFRMKQAAWLEENWDDTATAEAAGTNRFMFREEAKHGDYSRFPGDNIPEECSTCDDFTSLIRIDGTAYFDDNEPCCAGPEDCPHLPKAAGQNKTSPEEKPALRNHGEHFREIHYTTAIPERMEQLNSESLTVRQLTLISLIKSNSDLTDWFGETTGMEKEKINDYFSHYSFKGIFDVISTMTKKQVTELLHQAAGAVIMQDNFYPENRRLVADLLEIDLKKEWQITEEYLKKKTIAEIIHIGKSLRIFKSKHVLDYYNQVYGQDLNVEKLAAHRKQEIMDLFLESGVNLSGKVPEDILGE